MVTSLENGSQITTLCPGLSTAPHKPQHARPIDIPPWSFLRVAVSSRPFLTRLQLDKLFDPRPYGSVRAPPLCPPSRITTHSVRVLQPPMEQRGKMSPTSGGHKSLPVLRAISRMAAQLQLNTQAHRRSTAHRCNKKGTSLRNPHHQYSRHTRSLRTKAIKM